MFTDGANSQPKRRPIQHPRDDGNREKPEPDHWIANEREKPRTRLLAAETSHSRRVGRAAECETEKEPCQPDSQQVDRDTDHNLIGAKANCAHAVQERHRASAGDASENAKPRAVTVIAPDGSSERTAEHVALERQA